LELRFWLMESKSRILRLGSEFATKQHFLHNH